MHPNIKNKGVGGSILRSPLRAVDEFGEVNWRVIGRGKERNSPMEEWNKARRALSDVSWSRTHSVSGRVYPDANGSGSVINPCSYTGGCTAGEIPYPAQTLKRILFDFAL